MNRKRSYFVLVMNQGGLSLAEQMEVHTWDPYHAAIYAAHPDYEEGAFLEPAPDWEIKGYEIYRWRFVDRSYSKRVYAVLVSEVEV